MRDLFNKIILLLLILDVCFNDKYNKFYFYYLQKIQGGAFKTFHPSILSWYCHTSCFNYSSIIKSLNGMVLPIWKSTVREIKRYTIFYFISKGMVWKQNLKYWYHLFKCVIGQIKGFQNISFPSHYHMVDL